VEDVIISDSARAAWPMGLDTSAEGPGRLDASSGHIPSAGTNRIRFNGCISVHGLFGRDAPSGKGTLARRLPSIPHLDFHRQSLP
jgi:hypothetical protein